MKLRYEFVRSQEQMPASQIERINQLLRQLGPQATELALPGLAAAIAGCHLLLARDAEAGDMVVGLGCLACYTTLTARHGRVEDVVVDEEYRGHGIGQRITELLLAEAASRNIEVVSLTSRPARRAANELYKKLGFRLVETNVYAKDIERG